MTRSYVNLGFAVELQDGKGLIVPVVKNAETLNLLGLAKAVTDIAQRARDKKLLPDEVQGGTFTITNPGGYGTFHGTPVISQPQAAILGTYAVVKRAWVIQDDMGEDVIAIRPIMNLTLTYDHRLVDGALAGRFLRDLRHKLESWDESAYYVVDRQPDLVAALVQHQRAEGNDERRVDRSARPQPGRPPRFELPLGSDRLAVGRRHALAVGVEQLEPEHVLLIRLIPRNLEQRRDEEPERPLRVHHRPAAADHVQLARRHTREVGQEQSHLHPCESFPRRG